MTARIPKPKLGIDAPLPDYGAPADAVHCAVQNLLQGKAPVVEIDAEAYNEAAWQIVARSHLRRRASKAQVEKEILEIRKAALQLRGLLADASGQTFSALEGLAVDIGLGPTMERNFDFWGAQRITSELIQATEKAKPEGTKGRGPDADAIADEIGDMIARDFWLLTRQSPGLNNSLGYRKPTGRYAQFFKTIFSVIFPRRDFVGPARDAAARWKEKNSALLRELQDMKK